MKTNWLMQLRKIKIVTVRNKNYTYSAWVNFNFTGGGTHIYHWVLNGKISVTNVKKII
jgi:hypothetical protein